LVGEIEFDYIEKVEDVIAERSGEVATHSKNPILLLHKSQLTIIIHKLPHSRIKHRHFHYQILITQIPEYSQLMERAKH